jgi:ketosteroid isomerase-like protein
MKRSVRSILFSTILLAILISTVQAQAPRGQAGGGRPNIFAQQAAASGPIADLVNTIVTNFNNRDTAYFQKLISPDAVWLDEDGHHLIASVWMSRLMSANPPRKLTISNLRVGNMDNSGWAGFNYVLEGTSQVKGINTMVFKKTGNDWQIVMIHGAVDTAIVQH